MVFGAKVFSVVARGLVGSVMFRFAMRKVVLWRKKSVLEDAVTEAWARESI